MLTLVTLSAYTQQNPLPLYPGVIPGSKPTPTDYVEKTDEGGFVKQVSIPTITPYFPTGKGTKRPAVIVFPGGGYSGLAMDHEGRQIAMAFAAKGYVAFVVKYRLPDDRIMEDKSIGPLQDAQQAIHLVRERAGEWGIDPGKTGIIGFSAGGHLASTAATHFDGPTIFRDKVSLVPSFAILMYPVISFGKYAHVGSRENLIGREADSVTIAAYSNEKRVTEKTPPVFLEHSIDDDVVPVENSRIFAEALKANNIPYELLEYEKGGHGYGLNNPRTKDPWFDHCIKWLKKQKMN